MNEAQSRCIYIQNTIHMWMQILTSHTFPLWWSFSSDNICLCFPVHNLTRSTRLIGNNRCVGLFLKGGWHFRLRSFWAGLILEAQLRTMGVSHLNKKTCLFPTPISHTLEACFQLFHLKQDFLFQIRSLKRNRAICLILRPKGPQGNVQYLIEQSPDSNRRYFISDSGEKGFHIIRCRPMMNEWTVPQPVYEIYPSTVQLHLSVVIFPSVKCRKRVDRAFVLCWPFLWFELQTTWSQGSASCCSSAVKVYWNWDRVKQIRRPPVNSRSDCFTPETAFFSRDCHDPRNSGIIFFSGWENQKVVSPREAIWSADTSKGGAFLCVNWDSLPPPQKQVRLVSAKAECPNHPSRSHARQGGWGW